MRGGAFVAGVHVDVWPAIAGLYAALCRTGGSVVPWVQAMRAESPASTWSEDSHIQLGKKTILVCLSRHYTSAREVTVEAN